MLHSLLRDSALRTPDSAAVRCRGEEISYGQLLAQATALAASLQASGIGAGDRVGIWLPKGIEAIVSIHGVLMAGAAYVPVDPSGPPSRASYILGDCAVAGLITTGENAALLGHHMPQLGCLRLLILTEPASQDDPEVRDSPVPTRSWLQAATPGTAAVADPQRGPDQLAYILYTSGSTGAPKGVMLSHANAAVVVEWAHREFAFSPADRIASHAPLHFDLSIIDVFGAALAGATLVLVPEHQRIFGAALVRLAVAERITVWYSVPGALLAMLDASNAALLSQAALRVVLYAGESFPVRRLRELADAIPDAAIHNLYGPTETNVCTGHRVLPADLAGDVVEVPIGRLCDFASGHLIDADGHATELRPGAVGELVVGGESVMLGYWRHTASSPDARSPRLPERTHRTGDLVHVDSAGDLVFTGRGDDMVKIRGHRVEPAEVEAALLTSAQVREACVVARTDGEGALQLEAFVVPSNGAPLDIAQLRRACLQRLPRYMVPSMISPMVTLPRGSTGKVDRHALIATLAEPDAGDGA